MPPFIKSTEKSLGSRLDAYLGVVRAIGIRASRVRTYGGAEVIVPNGELIAAQVINWTLSDRNRRLELDVGVAYGNRPADVIALLEDVVRDHELVQKHPEPGVRFCGFGDSSLDFKLYVWVDFDEGLATTSAIMSDVYDALAEAGIEIPFPQRDLHLKTVDDSAGRALRGQQT